MDCDSEKVLTRQPGHRGIALRLVERLGDPHGQILINLVAGALGGVGVGKSSPTFDLGMIGNIISGLIGGGVLDQIVTLLLPAITAAEAVSLEHRTERDAAREQSRRFGPFPQSPHFSTSITSRISTRPFGSASGC
jgi:hypothetical protein